LKELLMSTISRQRRVVTVFLLLTALLFGSLPVRARAARGPAAETRKIAALGENALSWLRLFVSSLWHPEMTKEGPSIDPNGQPRQQGSDEGMSIDPDGRK
jgi:hypothetical protein